MDVENTVFPDTYILLFNVYTIVHITLIYDDQIISSNKITLL